MRCPKCGRTVPDTSPYCAYCGAQALTGISATSRSRSRSKVILAVSAVVLVGAVGLWAAGAIRPRSRQVAYVPRAGATPPHTRDTAAPAVPTVTRTPAPQEATSVPEPVGTTSVTAIDTPYLTSTAIPTVVVTPSSAPTSHDRPSLALGDNLVYDVSGSEFRYEIVDVGSLEGRATWVVLITTDSSFYEEYTATEWVDQETGVVLEYTSRSVPSTPQTRYLGGEAIEYVEDRFTLTYDLDKDTMDQVSTVVDTAGKEHELQQPFSANYDVFIVTPDLQVGDWYPWKTAEYTHRVIKGERVSVPAGAFFCWVIKHTQSKNQHYLGWYDTQTGVLVKHENWANLDGAWKIVGHTELRSCHISSVSP